MTKQDKDNVWTFRWLLVDNQEMTSMEVVKLIDGYHVSAEEARLACPGYSFEDCCFRVYKLDETVVLKQLIDCC